MQVLTSILSRVLYINFNIFVAPLAFRYESHVYPWWLRKYGRHFHYPVEWWQTSNPTTSGSQNTTTQWRRAPCHPVRFSVQVLFMMGHLIPECTLGMKSGLSFLIFPKGTMDWWWSLDKPGLYPVLLSLHMTVILLPRKSCTFLRVCLLKGFSSLRLLHSNWTWAAFNILLLFTDNYQECKHLRKCNQQSKSSCRS